jgi:hypothetical protein
MLTRFELSSMPSLAMLPSFVTPSNGGLGMNASVTLVGVTSGAYTVTARAVDAVGHVEALGVTVSFAVDLDAPTSRLVHSLTPFSSHNTVVVGVNASDGMSGVSSFVRVDSGVWQNMSTAAVSLSLVDGAHCIECRGIDAAGNAQPPPYDGVSVTVDTMPPVVSVAAGVVPAFNTLSVVSVTVTVSDATVTSVRGVLDGFVDTAVTRVGSGMLSVGVAADGNHTLVLSSEDAAGNTGSVVSVSWYTDRVAPLTSASLTSASSLVRDPSANVSVSTANEAYPSLCVACWQYAVVSASGSTLVSMGRCESTRMLSFAYTSGRASMCSALTLRVMLAPMRVA